MNEQKAARPGPDTRYAPGPGHRGDRVTPSRWVKVRLMHVPGCPLIDRVRADLQHALAVTGSGAVIEDVEGDYPSPTLLIDGLDTVTGRPINGATRCRLDLPTREQIATALSRAVDR